MDAPQFLDANGNPIEAPASLDAAGNPLPPRDAGPSLRGLYTNAVHDVEGLLGSLDPRNWAGMNRDKQAADQELADQVRHPDTAFSLPGDRLAKQITGIPGVLYDNPVQSALALAPFAKPAAQAVASRVPGVIAKATSIATDPRTAAVAKATVKGAANVGTFGTTGRIAKAAGEIHEAMKPAAKAAPEPVAAAPVRPADALAKELLMREPDWRTVDAVPINAMKAKGILEPGESRVGLAERAAVAQKAKDAAEVDRLLKALRQRMNISASAGR